MVAQEITFVIQSPASQNFSFLMPEFDTVNITDFIEVFKYHGYHNFEFII